MNTLLPDAPAMRLRYVPPVSLPPLVQADIMRAGAWGAWTEPPGSQRRFTRHAPEFVDDPDVTGLLPGFGAATYTSPPVLVTAMDDAMLFGYRALASNGVFCTDEPGGGTEDRALTDKLAQPDPFANEDTGLRPDGAGGGFVLPTAGRPHRAIPGTAVSLCSHEPSNYGSLLFRVAPKLATVQALGLGGLPVVAWAANPAFRQVLELCGVDPSRLVLHEPHALTSLGRVIAPSLRNPHGFLDGASHAFMQRVASGQPAVPGRRLYVSRLGQARRGASSRVMLNEAEAARALSALGFEVFEPEACSPAEQVAAFASADMVVGPAGSGLFNVAFCRPGTKVLDIESEMHWVYAHAGLFASCQLRYGLFMGAVDPADPNQAHRRFTVNIPALVSRVQSWMQ